MGRRFQVRSVLLWELIRQRLCPCLLSSTDLSDVPGRTAPRLRPLAVARCGHWLQRAMGNHHSTVNYSVLDIAGGPRHPRFNEVISNYSHRNFAFCQNSSCDTNTWLIVDFVTPFNSKCLAPPNPLGSPDSLAGFKRCFGGEGRKGKGGEGGGREGYPAFVNRSPPLVLDKTNAERWE